MAPSKKRKRESSSRVPETREPSVELEAEANPAADLEILPALNETAPEADELAPTVPETTGETTAAATGEGEAEVPEKIGWEAWKDEDVDVYNVLLEEYFDSESLPLSVSR